MKWLGEVVAALVGLAFFYAVVILTAIGAWLVFIGLLRRLV